MTLQFLCNSDCHHLKSLAVPERSFCCFLGVMNCAVPNGLTFESDSVVTGISVRIRIGYSTAYNRPVISYTKSLKIGGDGYIHKR